MTRVWRWIKTPSLTRRLLVAQMALLAVVWSLALAFLVHEEARDEGELRTDQLYDVLLYVTAALDGQPERRHQALVLADRAMRQTGGKDGPPGLGMLTVVRVHGRIVYATPGAPSDVTGVRDGAVEYRTAAGNKWAVRTMRDRAAGIEITRMKLGNDADLFLSLTGRGYYVLPLLVSLPFLVLPAWLSIRLALRPWRRAAGDIAARGPHDLSPIAPLPHREAMLVIDSVNALLRRVEESALRERRFIADAAHELRTPLAAMRVNVEALQRQAVAPAQAELLAGIVRASERATRLVGQLLLLMRSDAAGAEAARPLALDALVQDRLAALARLADGRGVELALEAEEGLIVRAQEGALVSLVDNVIDNAIKYSPPGGTVSVTLARADGMVQLCVSDSGPGVPEALRERVFERFFRAPDQVQQGSGLGLAIARAVVDGHGGDIAIRDVDAGGCLICARLPAA
ncbi:two-component system, OmpR family, sensor histidine kinase QseC [Massilia sp. PDC64]|nr:ATP-binding protein [Massilia sp. PDC64]SDE90580.1 two-component system, OmpR family, sensor histidine kinase QseC [Massilia sp. PDC64]